MIIEESVRDIKSNEGHENTIQLEGESLKPRKLKTHQGSR